MFSTETADQKHDGEGRRWGDEERDRTGVGGKERDRTGLGGKEMRNERENEK